jgi:hypothetical protein
MVLVKDLWVFSEWKLGVFKVKGELVNKPLYESVQYFDYGIAEVSRIAST